MARHGNATKQNFDSWVESLQSILPVSYRQKAIYSLLSDIAWTIVQLKQLLTEDADPIVRLDRVAPGWRERFPLPLDESDGRSLVENLVREAARIKVEKTVVALPVERTLEPTEDGKWALRSRIDLPTNLDFRIITKLFGASEADLPLFAELSLEAGEKRGSTVLRKMAGVGSYRVARTPWGFSHDAAAQEHLLHLAAPDGRTWSVTAIKGFALDEDLPWVFLDDGGGLRFWRQGNGGIPSEQGVLLASKGTELVIGDSESSIDQIGECIDLDRELHRFGGTILASTPSGSFKIRTNQPSEEESFEWKGDRLWLPKSSPSMIFRGMPSVYSVSEDGATHKLSGELGCSLLGNSEIAARIGPLDLRYPSSGSHRCRTKAVIIEPEAKLKFGAQSTSSGWIDFVHWGVCHAESDTPGLEVYTSSENGTLRVGLTAAGGTPPAQVQLRLYWSYTTVPATLTLPFPAQGVRVLNAKGEELSNGSNLAVQQLNGCRLILVGAAQQQVKFLTLRAKRKNIHRKFAIHISPGSFSTEIRLSDYRSDISHLLTIDEDPDSTVLLTAGTADKDVLSIVITPHEGNVELCGDSLRVLIGTADPVHAPAARLLRLETPGDEPIELTPSESGNLGEWQLDLNGLSTGTWLVYPSKGSSLAFRPTSFPVAASDHEWDSEFATVIGTPNEQERWPRIDALVEALSLDLSHPSWFDVEQLASQTGHLPLATFDLWRRFARSSRAMAALAFRAGNLSFQFLERFGMELPFAWETVAYRDWKAAAELFRDDCCARYSGDETVFGVLFRDRIEELIAFDNSLFYLLNILRSQLLLEWEDEVRMLRAAGLQNLLSGEHGPLMRLRRSHGENEEWPVEFVPFLRECRQDPRIVGYMVPDRLGFQDGVINVPLLVAAQVAEGSVSCWFKRPDNVHLLRNVRAFDPEWFESAYNLTIQRCLAHGLLD